MAKKVFFHRRHKLPPWAQAYSIWGVVALVILGIVFFTSVERVQTQNISSINVGARNYSESLFYDLREANLEDRFDTIYSYTKRLDKKKGVKLSQEKTADCVTLHLSQSGTEKYRFIAPVEGNKTHTVFHLLSFLEYVTAHHPQATFDAYIFFSGKKCNMDEAISSVSHEKNPNTILLDTDTLDSHYNKVGHLKNLNLRSFFESSFLSIERTHWANIMATVAKNNQKPLVLSIKSAWEESPEAQINENPLWRHPLLHKKQVDISTEPVALYLWKNLQLYNGGFFVTLLLLWLLGFLPFINAVGTFKEKLGIAPALTTMVLYALAFFVYLLITKALLSQINSDLLLIIFLVALFFLIFLPLRFLQKRIFRAELNRAGIHLWTLFFLTISLFLNPLVALFGICCLMLLSALQRASTGKKLMRLVVLVFLFFIVVSATKHPLGTFSNYLAQLLPSFSAVGVLKLFVVAFIGGGLTAFLFVPRERT
ncbi:MAG: hypothetical protein LDLANPLL_02682 [Turneriella sp.]|nr:hypothetical protein [Turneriella sp.]